MAAIGRPETSKRALQLLRKVLYELRPPTPKSQFRRSTAAYLLQQYRDHQLTARTFCKGTNELEHLMDCYHEYLASTRQLNILLTTYKSTGERSTEEAANLVGLSLPVKNEEKTEPDNLNKQ